ncbi:hypothetical protein BX666DRAFT_1849238 [Dichotomocladium elegans]|nr:hypothetical protein BX666DRAFT_1849238 [Dichotomocladium elegans]
MDTNYFLTNDVSKWCLRTAFQSQEEKTPNLSIRHVLQALKSDVKAAAKSEEPERAKAAEDLLHNWRTVKSSLMLRRDKKQKPMLKNVTGSITVMNASGPITLHYNDNRGSSSSTSPAITAKRSVQEEEGNSTPEGSWDSAEKNKRRKYLNVYLSSSFGETDFGDDEDTSPKLSILLYQRYETSLLT